MYYVDDNMKQHRMHYEGYDCQKKCLRYSHNGKIYKIYISYDERVFLPVARDSMKFGRLYKGWTAVERLNGRLGRDYKFEDHSIRGLKKMTLVNNADGNWSEDGKTGRLFILFVSLILSSWVRHIWKSTELSDLFSSSLEILDEMRPIRLIEHTNRAKVITPFVGKQVDICEAFGFSIPDGCAPVYTSRQKPKRKQGRPPKPKVEYSL